MQASTTTEESSAGRTYRLVDRLCCEAQSFLQTICGGHQSPKTIDYLCQHNQVETSLPKLLAHDKNLSANLMRVNHSGEVAAQALYRGQALTSTDHKLRQELYEGADEEIEHLVWCRQRLTELSDRPSYLDPIWYVGSFSLGAVVGLLPQQWALGFIEETEIQVTAHLGSHLKRISAHDHRSIVVLQTMREDEQNHAQWARERQSIRPPPLARTWMTQVARLMTTGSFYL